MADKKKKKKKAKKPASLSNKPMKTVAPEVSEVKEDTAKVQAEASPDQKPAEKVVADKKPVKKPVKKAKNPGFFARIGRKFKEIFSELKKVTWPTFPTVLKQTGVVLVVVAFFLVFIFAIDSGFAALFKLLFPAS